MVIPILRRSLSSLSPPPPPPPDPSQTLVSTVVQILTHHRSKSRWTHLRSLSPPTGFTPSQVSQITLRIRNNPHLALRFFLFTLRHSLSTPSLLSYSTLIHTLSRSRLLKPQTLTLIQSALLRFPDTDKTPKLFQSLVKTYRECDSAPFVFDLLIKACLRSTRIDQAMEIARMLKSRGISPSVSSCNSVIRSVSKYHGCYAGYDFYKEVFGFGDEGKSRTVGVFKVVPNVHTFNVIMLGFHQDGLVGNVEEVWGEMAALGCEPSGYSYSILMAAYCEDGKMGEAVKLWEEMGIKGFKPDFVAYNTMIGGFCKICEVGRAEEFFREMGLSGVEHSCVTFEHLINGYCQIGDVDSALLLYKDMCRKGFRLESSTVDAVMGGLGGENRVSEALEFLRVAIRKHEIAPKRKSYEVLIKGLCQEGRMEEALKLQAEMVGKGFEPNCEIYSAFIEANTKDGNVELAEMLKKEMFETQMPKEEE
ncbi:hypothetical protein RHMOL_Rhmol11G0254900 [Rhododendron molle]|uniref:Uncharacterized protein n=1 Tax=Rhododendron molle TaxID=49168 RepID=A0ACC0LW22_RHOML|nr:hypothetical protein RHMOL_Rhmol11G0254900 [Rhododendron molle]